MSAQPTQRAGALVDSKGRRVPSISTVLRKFQDPTNLLNWAWRMGVEGTSLDDARKAGNTLGHLTAALALELIGGPAVNRETWPQEWLIASQRPVAAFHRWADETGALAPIEMPMVSDRLGFGGVVTTATVRGETVVLSLKAGKGVYLEDVLTVAAQAQLADVQRAVVIRFGKDAGGFDECRTLGPVELGAAWLVFDALLTAYKYLRPVEAIVAGKAAA